MADYTCPICHSAYASVYARPCCTRCSAHQAARSQLEAGETCAGCGRPPTPRSPLRGQRSYGKDYCSTCRERVRAGLPPQKSPQAPDTPQETTIAHRRALDYWLSRNWRVRERQAA